MHFPNIYFLSWTLGTIRTAWSRDLKREDAFRVLREYRSGELGPQLQK